MERQAPSGRQRLTCTWYSRGGLAYSAGPHKLGAHPQATPFRDGPPLALLLGCLSKRTASRAVGEHQRWREPGGPQHLFPVCLPAGVGPAAPEHRAQGGRASEPGLGVKAGGRTSDGVLLGAAAGRRHVLEGVGCVWGWRWGLIAGGAQARCGCKLRGRFIQLRAALRSRLSRAPCSGRCTPRARRRPPARAAAGACMVRRGTGAEGRGWHSAMAAAASHHSPAPTPTRPPTSDRMQRRPSGSSCSRPVPVHRAGARSKQLQQLPKQQLSPHSAAVPLGL